MIRTGLVGAGIQQSSSPALHMSEGQALGLGYNYELFDLDLFAGGAGALPEILAEAERRQFDGLNITYPCKQAVIAQLHELSPEAEALQSVNTVLFRAGRRIGHNTDWYGFAESFRRQFADAALDRVALIGAGGAGAAIAYSALKLGVRELRIVDLQQESAAALADRCARAWPECVIKSCTEIHQAVDRADGLIHATPMGMLKLPGMAVPAALLRPPLWVADVVYVPLVTELLRVARAQGCRTLDGSGMAVYQAAMAFELFSGVKPDASRMSRAFRSLATTGAAA